MLWPEGTANRDTFVLHLVVLDIQEGGGGMVEPSWEPRRSLGGEAGLQGAISWLKTAVRQVGVNWNFWLHILKTARLKL